MKKIIFSIVIIIIVSCNDVNVRHQIENALSAESGLIPKIELFSNAEQLKKEIKAKSGFDITKSKPRLIRSEGRTSWHTFSLDERTEEYSLKNGYDKWRTSTWYETFGTYSLINESCKNEIGYDLYGKEMDTINEVNIVLNLYAPHDKEEAFSRLANEAKQTLEILNIEPPAYLNENIARDNLYYYENELCYLMLTMNEKTRENDNFNADSKLVFNDIIEYEQYTFIIKSK
jgi:hypothetical protein